ncbi:MAG: hypothetical protein E7491_09700 [Ruminococcaceae bacterium]|nr:hypothetical protein [Oscillospiraceae bacterium]
MKKTVITIVSVTAVILIAFFALAFAAKKEIHINRSYDVHLKKEELENEITPKELTVEFDLVYKTSLFGDGIISGTATANGEVYELTKQSVYYDAPFWKKLGDRLSGKLPPCGEYPPKDGYVTMLSSIRVQKNGILGGAWFSFYDDYNNLHCFFTEKGVGKGGDMTGAVYISE